MKYLLPLLLLVAACSPFTVSPPTEPQLPQSFLGAPQQEADKLPERWWEMFADPELNRLQQQLLSGNLDLRQALYRLEQLDALQRASGAGLWPTLTLSGTTGRDRTLGITGSSISESSRISLAAGYEVDLWNRLRNKTEAAELRRQAGQQEVQTLLLSLTAQLTEQYFFAAEQRAQLELLQQQVERNRRLVENTTERYRAGLATASELYQSRRGLSQSESRIPQYRTGLSQAENSIALLLGQLPQIDMTQIRELPTLTSLVDSGLPASLLTSRPDIAAALLQLQAVDLELAAALADRLPAVNLTAALGRSTTQLLTGNLEGSFWSLALGLTQPLLDGGRRQAESDRQQALREERIAAYQQTILQAVQEVVTALSADQNSAERVAWLAQQQQFSTQELALAQDNYRSGLTGSSTLLSSEIGQLETASQNLSAQRQWLSNRITLARALGGNWMADELAKQQQELNKKTGGRE